MHFRFFRVLSVLACALVASTAQAATTTIYATDFDGTEIIQPGLSGGYGYFTNATASGSYAGSNGKTWSGNFIRNATGSPPVALTFTFSNLVAHDAISIDFMLGFLDSWDSTNGSPAPDYLSISIEGGTPVLLTTATASGSVSFYAGGTQIVDNGQIDSHVFYSDDLVDMGTAGFLTFAHNSSTLTFTLVAAGAGWQDGTDEGWGIDDLRITAITRGTSVPEPGTPSLFGPASRVWLGCDVAKRR